MAPTKEDLQQIWSEVKANQKRLAECPRPHDLERVEQSSGVGRWKCRKCAGTIEFVAGAYYNEGLEDGKK